MIFDQMFADIAAAETFIVADFFLWNPWMGVDQRQSMRPAEELAQALIDKRIQDPGLPILVITDPINLILASTHRFILRA